MRHELEMAHLRQFPKCQTCIHTHAVVFLAMQDDKNKTKGDSYLIFQATALQIVEEVVVLCSVLIDRTGPNLQVPPSF